MKNLEFELLKIGKRNLNGRIYTQEVADRIMEQFNQKRHASGYFFGTLHPSDLTATLDFQKISHDVTSLKIRGNSLVGYIRILDTPSGNVLKNIIGLSHAKILLEITQPTPVVFRPRFSGTVNNEGVVDMFELISFDAIDEKEDSFRDVPEYWFKSG